jgi:hypothetical protein
MIFRTRSNLVWQVVFTIAVCGFFGNFAVAQEPDPRELLSRMSNEVANLQQFTISGDASADARLDAGLILEQTTQATMSVSKPNSVRITTRTAEDLKELYFKSNELTIYTRSMNFYGHVRFPEGTTNGLNYAIDELGIDVPMMDFVTGDVAERLLADATEVIYLGKSLVRDSIYEQVAIRTPEIDVQIWIAAEGPPLPGKMALSAKWDGGSPRTVIFMEWDTEPAFPDDIFDFEPPDGAQQITIEPLFYSEE